VTKNISSVLIADVIHSRRELRLRALLGEKLGRATAAHLREKWIRVPYSVTAGDEFQVVPSRIETIPELILDLRRRMRPFSLRVGVGIGDIRGPIRTPVNRLHGEAFIFARQAIDDVKEGALYRYRTLTAFCSARKSFDRIANLVYGLNDTLLLDITDAQWRTMDAYFKKGRVDRTARSLHLDISTASRSLKRGSYWQLAEVASTMKAVLRDEWM
jgi:hypothetical protein